jgi:hypothetical protein
MSRLGATLVLLTACAHAAMPGFHDSGDPESYVPLVQAMVDQDMDRVRSLLADPATDVNAVDVIPPLFAAQEYIFNSKTRHWALRQLLKAGALVDQPTDDGSTTLMVAAYHGDVRASQLLLDHGADPLRMNKQEGNAILAARRGGHKELALMLEEHVGESGLRQMGELMDQRKVEL